MFKKHFTILFLISLLVISFGCNVRKQGITDPDEPINYTYKAKVKAVYVRNPADIVFPEGNDKGTQIRYRIYDPEAEKNKFEHEYVDGSFRVGFLTMTKVAENRFEAEIEKVIVHADLNIPKHEAYIRDLKLYDGMGDPSMNTANNLAIEGAYSIEISNRIMYFKLQ